MANSENINAKRLFDPTPDLPEQLQVLPLEDVCDYITVKENLKEIKAQYNLMVECGDIEDPETKKMLEMVNEQEEYINEFKKTINSFDSECLYKNICNLAQASKLKMGDIDELVGVSTGYVMKGIAPDSNRRLSIDVVVKLAKLFHVNLDELVNTDLNEPTRDLKKAVGFLEILDSETETSEMRWEQYTDFIKNNKADNLLFIKGEDGEPTYAPNGVCTLSTNYGRIYKSDTKAGKLFLVQVQDILFGDIHYEMYMYDEKKIKERLESGINTAPLTKICFSEDDGSGLLKEKMNHLYNTVVTHEKDFTISERALEYIDLLMQKSNYGRLV